MGEIERRLRAVCWRRRGRPAGARPDHRRRSRIWAISGAAWTSTAPPFLCGDALTPESRGFVPWSSADEPQDAERFEACADNCAGKESSPTRPIISTQGMRGKRATAAAWLAPLPQRGDGVARPERRLSGSGRWSQKPESIGVDAAGHGDGRGCWTGHGASLSVDEHLAIRERSGIYRERADFTMRTARFAKRLFIDHLQRHRYAGWHGLSLDDLVPASSTPRLPISDGCWAMVAYIVQRS